MSIDMADRVAINCGLMVLTHMAHSILCHLISSIKYELISLSYLQDKLMIAFSLLLISISYFIYLFYVEHHADGVILLFV